VPDVYFYIQAEDGIRDRTVTGVQTCALPIFTPEQKKHIKHAARIKGTSVSDFVIGSAQDAAARTIREYEVLTLNEKARTVFVNRSEERRVGKECRSRW